MPHRANSTSASAGAMEKSLTVLSFGGVSLGGSKGDERDHVVRISLSPLMSREDIHKEVVKDQATKRLPHALYETCIYEE